MGVCVRQADLLTCVCVCVCVCVTCRFQGGTHGTCDGSCVEVGILFGRLA